MAEQKILSVIINGKKVLSKEWDFEAMCLVDDARSENEKAGKLRMTETAISYLFTGTAATDAEIKKLSNDNRAVLAITVFKWYLNDIENALKNVQSLPQ